MVILHAAWGPVPVWLRRCGVVIILRRGCPWRCVRRAQCTRRLIGLPNPPLVFVATWCPLRAGVRWPALLRFTLRMWWLYRGPALLWEWHWLRCPP